MTHNAQSVVYPIRLDREALEFYEWEAMLTGVPARTRIRTMLEDRAERMSRQLANIGYDNFPLREYDDVIGDEYGNR